MATAMRADGGGDSVAAAVTVAMAVADNKRNCLAGNNQQNAAGGSGSSRDSGRGSGNRCSVAATVGERTKSTREKKRRNKSVSWGGETRAVSHEKTSFEGILKRSHVAKPCGQKICKEQG
jgi:hypothetical protein